MLFDVYFFNGDPVDALSAGAKTGELFLTPNGKDDGLMAHLYQPGTNTDLLTPIRHTRVVAMNEKGMTIEGYVWAAARPNLKAKATAFKIRWVIKQVGAPAVLNTRKLKERSARRLAAAAASGFDPADDDLTN